MRLLATPAEAAAALAVSRRTLNRIADGLLRWRVLAGWWLERLSDEEIAEAALFMFGHRPDRAHICSERERLLGVVVAA